MNVDKIGLALSSARAEVNRLRAEVPLVQSVPFDGKIVTSPVRALDSILDLIEAIAISLRDRESGEVVR